MKDDLGSMHPYYAGLHPEVIHHILSIDPQRCDDTTTSQNETCSEQLVRALELAITELSAQYGTDIASWRWGAAHRLRLIHPFLKTIPFLEYFTGRDIATDGGDFTLNRGQTNPYPCCDLSKTITSWPHVHGAGYRAVYDLSDLNRSGFVITTGQSGHVLSSHYLDMVDPWRSGAMITLPETLDGPRGQTLSILTLAPEVRP
ncbi:MAG: penicillin acylase family protein [Alphaproteobacteria bacterium]